MNILGKEYDATTVEGLKEYLLEKADKKVETDCEIGFTYDGRQFSLSDRAQKNLSDLHQFQSILTFPKAMGTLDNLGYSLAQSNVMPFIGTALIVVETILTNCRNKKAEILACTTMEQLQIIQNDL